MDERSPRIDAPKQPAQRHHALPFTAVELQDGLWAPRQRWCASAPCRSSTPRYEKNGMFEALDVNSPPGPLRLPFNGRPTTPVMYWDSDIAKWIEMASYTLAAHADPALDALIDDVVARIAQAQQPDGYFNTYFTRREPAKRWTNLRDWHELYCAGHLIEAAVAHVQATGKSSLLDVMRRYADCIATIFGPRREPATRLLRPPGDRARAGEALSLHQGAPLSRPREISSSIERGRQPHYFDQEAIARGDDPAAQYLWHLRVQPVARAGARAARSRRSRRARHVSLQCDGRPRRQNSTTASLMAACKTLWADLTTKRLYVTGGLGPSARNEGFTTDYDLPNETAYAETCAAVGLIFWAHRMLLIEGDARYADMMELALYNGALSGLSLDGEHFFYENPLASRGGHRRWTWHRCPCCPPNIGRLVASLGQYVYSTADRTRRPCISTSQGSARSVDRRRGRLCAAEDAVSMGWRDRGSRSNRSSQLEFALRLRIPGWCRSAGCRSTGRSSTSTAVMDRGYAACPPALAESGRGHAVSRMPVERIYAHPEVAADTGRVALKRGPIVYCLEGADNDAPVRRSRCRASNPDRRAIRARSAVRRRRCSPRTALATRPSEDGALYSTDPPGTRPTTLHAIPYSFWSNRDSDEMSVWIREI